MSNSDVEGKTPYVGAKVVLAGAGRGASEMWLGHIVSIHPKSVNIKFKETYLGWEPLDRTVLRNAGCYYIIEENKNL